MRISATFLKTYPKLSVWMGTDIPKVQNKHKVWQAFVKYSELPPVKASWAITPGYNPDIHFEKMPGSNGQFVGQKLPNRIYLAKAIFDKFEKSDFADPRMRWLVESTVLHEMVHWGDWKDGKDQAGEEGKDFEVAAYGKDITRYW